MLYMKLTGDPEIVSVPFCEMFDAATNVKYDHARTKLLTESTGVYTVCFVADMGKITKKPFEVPADELAKTYATVLYNNKRQILMLAIQPEGELLVSEVQQLLES